MANNYQSEDEAYFDKEEESKIDQMIAQAVEAAAKGENIDQLLELLQSSAPASKKDAIKKKFAAALKKRGLRTPSGQVADTPPRSALDRLRNALAITAQQALERVVMLVRSRPDVAARVQEAGQMLARNGVTVDRIQIREAELGNLAPGVTAAKSQQRGDTGRGA